MNLETLVLELVADDSKLSRDIDSAVKKATKKLAAIEKVGAISPSVDLDSLHELNKVLDSKQRHIKETAKVFNSTPIVVKIDTSSVGHAKSEVAALRGELAGVSTTVKAEITHKFEGQKQGTNQTVAAIKELRGGLKDIVNVVKSTKSSSIGGALKGLVGAAISTPMTIVKGALMGFGQDVVKDFSKGFKESINSQFSSKIGSTELLGKRFASKLTDDIGGVLNAIDKALDDLFQDVDGLVSAKSNIESKLKDVFVSPEAIEENLVQSQKRAKKQKQRKSSVREGKKTFAIELANESDIALAESQQAFVQYKKMSAQFKPSVIKADTEAAKIAQENVSIQDQIEKRQSEGDAWGEVPALENKKRVNEAKIKQLSSYSNQMKDQLIAKAEQVEYLEKKAQELTARAKKYIDSYNRELLVQDNMRSILQDLGVNISQDEMPSVVVGKMRKGADATYNAYKNQITVSQSTMKRLQSPDFATTSKDANDYRVLAHELTHGEDLGFGSDVGIASQLKGRSKGSELGISVGQALTIQGKNSLHGFLKNYRNNPNYQGIQNVKLLEMYAESTARQASKSKFGVEEFNPLDLLKKKADSALSVSSQVSSMVKGNPLLTQYESQLTAIAKEMESINETVDKIESIGQIDYTKVDDSFVDSFQSKVLATISSVANFEGKLNELVSNIESTMASTEKYSSDVSAIEAQLDDAFNLEDLQLLQDAKKRIAKALKELNNDDSLNEQSKKILTNQFKDLQKKAKVDTRTVSVTAKDVMRNPFDAMSAQVEKSTLQLADKGVELVHAFVDPLVETANNVMQLASQVASDPTKSLMSAGSAIVKGGNQGIRAIAPAIGSAYSVASGIENAALSVLPYGHLAKKGLQVGAVTMGLPMAAATIPALAPVAGMLGMAGHMGGAAASGLAASQMAGISSIPIVGGQITGILTSAAGGLGTIVAEMTTAAIAVNAVSVGTKALIGTALEPQTKQKIAALKPAQDEIKQATAKKTSRLIEKAQNIDTYLPTLPESQRKLIAEYLPKVAALEQANQGDFIPQGVSLPGLKALAPADYKQLDPVMKSAVKDDWVAQYKAAQKNLFEFAAKVRGSIDPLDRMKGDIASLSSAFKAQVKRMEKQGQSLGFDVSKHKLDPSAYKGVTLDADAVEMPDISKMKRSATDTVKGFAEGTKQGEKQVELAFVELAQSGQDAFDKEMGIQSPSKWAIERIRFIAQGLSNGVKSFKSWVMAEGEDLAEDLVTGFESVSPPRFPIPERVANLPTIPDVDNNYGDHFDRLKKYDEFYDDAIKTLAEVDTTGIDQYNQSLESLSKNAYIALQALEKMGMGASKEAQNLRELISLSDFDKRVKDNSIKGSGSLTYTLSPVDDDVADAAIRNAQESLDRIDDAMNEFDNPNPVRQVKMLFGELGDNVPIIGGVIKKFDELKSSIKKFGMIAVSGLGLALLAKGLFDVGKGALEAYQNIEGVFIASKLLKGSEQFISDLRQQSLQLGSDLQSTLEQGIRFSSALVGTPLESMSQQMFQDASTALTYMGLQQQQYDSALLALTQVASKGRVSLEEITGQLGEAVPGIMPIVANALGTNVQGAIQQIESGNVLAEDLMPKLIAGMKNRTAGLAPIYERSLTASTGRVGTALQGINIGIGEQLAPAVIPAINKVAEALISVSENIDKVMQGVKYLAIGLTANLGVALAGVIKSFMAYNGVTLTSINVTKLFSVTVNALKIALKPLLIALGAIAAFEAINFALNFDGDQEIKDGIKNIDNLILKVNELKNAEQDRMKQLQADSQRSNSLFNRNAQTQRGMSTGNIVLDTLGGVSALLGGNTYGNIAASRNLDRQVEFISKINEAFGSGGVANIFNTESLEDYSSKLADIDYQIDILQGRGTALRLVDAQANSDAIDAVNKQIKELNDQRTKLTNDFLLLGPDGINQAIDGIKAQIAFAENLRVEAQAGGNEDAFNRATSNIQELTNQLELAEKAAKIYDDRMKELGNTLNAQRLAFIDLSAAVVQANVSINDTLNAERTALTNSQIDNGLQSQINQFQDLSFAVHDAQKRLESLQDVMVLQKQYIGSNKIDAQIKQTIEDVAGKSINDLNAGDVERLKLLAENDTQGRLKEAFNSQVVGVLEQIGQTNSQIIEAGKSLADARKALAEFNITQEDYFINTARQIEDLNFQIESQQIQDQRSLQDLSFQLQDASVSLQRSNRALSEAYQDMAFDFNVQVATVGKAINDAQDQLELTRLKINNLSITPGNTSSIARQIDDILLRYSESVFGTQSNERQIKIDILNLEKERIQRLRQIRDFEERQMDATRDFNRQIITLQRAFFDLERNMKQAAIGFIRQIFDMTRAMKLADNSSPRAIQLRGQLQAVPQYNPRMVLPAPTGQIYHPIDPITNERNRIQTQVNQSRPVTNYAPGDTNILKDAMERYNGFPANQSKVLINSLQSSLNFPINSGNVELAQIAQLGGFIEGVIKWGTDLSNFIYDATRKPFSQNKPRRPGNSALDQLKENYPATFGEPQKPPVVPPTISNPNSQEFKQRQANPPSNRTRPQQTTQQNPANVAIPMAQRLNLAKHYSRFYNQAHSLNLNPEQLELMAKALAEYRSSDKKLQQQFERYVNLSDAERRTVVVEMQKIEQQNKVAQAKVKQNNQTRPLGSQSILNGKPVYWAGEDWKWQSEASYRKLLQNNFQRPTPPTIKAQATITQSSQTQTANPGNIVSQSVYQEPQYVYYPQPQQDVPFIYQESAPLPQDYNPYGYYESVQDTSIGGYNFQSPQVQPIQPLLNQAATLENMNNTLIELRNNGVKAEALLNFVQMNDSLNQLINGLDDATLASNRNVEDTTLSVNQLVESSKGWLTITQKVNRAGSDTFTQYENQIRTLSDTIRDKERLLQNSGSSLIKLEAEIEKAVAMGFDSSNLEAQKQKLDKLIESERVNKDSLKTLLNQVTATQDIAVANAQNNAYLQEQLNYLDKMAGLAASISSARYDLGGSLINEAPILQARIAMATAEQRAFLQGQADGLDGQALTEYVDMSKELASINYKKSFSDAIPFVKELGANLKEAVFETNDFTEAFSKLLRVMASDIFDRLVLMPLTNKASQWIGEIFNLGSQKIPTLTGSLSVGNQIVNNPTVSDDGQVKFEPFNQAIETVAQTSQSYGSELANLTTLTTTQVVTEQAALNQFVAALQVATQALYRFAVTASSGGISSGAGGVFGTIGKAVGGLFGGNVNSLAGDFIPSNVIGVDSSVSLPTFANGLTEQRMTGRKPMLAIVNEGEAILSTLNGDAQKFQALKRSGTWDDIPNFANGIDRFYNDSRNYRGNWSMDAMLPSAQTRQTINNQRNQVVNQFSQNYTIVTPNADSFRKSQAQIQDEGARTYRRKMR